MGEVLSIQELLDKALETKEKRIRSGKFSPSSLGKCYRAQYYNRKDEPVSNLIDKRTQRVFKAGGLFHRFVQDVLINAYPEAQKEVLVETDDFKGYADLVINGEVLDIKSQHSRAFWHRRDLTWQELEPKLLPNILQVVFYALNLGKDRARLVFLSKDDLSIQEYPIEVKKWSGTLNQEIVVLTDSWAKQKLPPAVPRCYPDKNNYLKECEYCSWRDTCWNLEGWGILK